MKSYNKIIVLCVVLILALLVVVNLIFFASPDEDYLYKVEINRVEYTISTTGSLPDVKNYDTILGIYEEGNTKNFFKSEHDYVIRELNNKRYRIEYTKEPPNTNYVLTINLVLLVFSFFMICILFYIRHNILKPFDQILDLPYMLSKGTLTVPLKENKQRYFGKFLWGLDMLRETLEDSKRAELAFKKEKKTMLLSLSHDIKTPLSAIKLYAQALASGIYKDKHKQIEVANSINAKADEIEQYVSEIIHSQTENIINFQVINREFYLSEAINNISLYYGEKLQNTTFTISEFRDCIISGDPDRLVEVLQNIIENAIKYGDGNFISLDFFDEEDCRIVTVRNSGCTLEKNELRHIFDSFFRGSNIASNSGSGLGLYICRQLTKAMNGDVYADIENNQMCVSVVCRKKY